MIALHVARAGRVYEVVAVETSRAAMNAEDVFDDHAHKSLGCFSSRAKAFKDSEAYAKTWAKRQAAITKKCGCDEISEKGKS